jgi:16S rRNA processing protein RimM
LNSPEGKPLVLGRVKGVRGPHGEVTVTVVSGDAARWVHLGRVVLGAANQDLAGKTRKVESARAYRDRLVLKLAGVDDANQAAALRGYDVGALAEDVPELPPDVYWVEHLVGAQVTDSVLGDIGRVKDVIETGGVDVLLVRDAGGVETMVPLVKKHVTAIDARAGTIRVSLPAGLREINDGEQEQA